MYNINKYITSKKPMLQTNRNDRNSIPHTHLFNKKNEHTYNNARDEAMNSYSSLIFMKGEMTI